MPVLFSSNVGLRKLENLGLQTPTLYLLCDILIVYLRMTLEKNVNSSNKRCTIVYKQSSTNSVFVVK